MWNRIRTALLMTAIGCSLPGLVIARAIPCSDLGFDPETEGEGILERFFVETDGIGGLGCWMHPHPNGKDAVFTPFSWGANPNPGKQGLIDETMAAIRDTSDFLRTLGTVDSELYILLTDLVREDWSAEAHVIENERCWIEVTAAAGWGYWGAGVRRELKSTVAHEISHCFFPENFEDYNEQGTGFDMWWDESGADYLMAQIYPAVNSEHQSSLEFDLDGQEFMQEYNAVVLFQHWSNENGVPSTLEFIRSAWENGRTQEAYASFLEASSLGEFFHDFNSRHYRETVFDPGGGNMPREGLVESIDSQRIESEFGNIEVGRIEPRRLNVVDLTLAEGRSVTIDAPGGVQEDFHASIYFNGQDLADWSEGIEIRGMCGTDFRFPLLLTTLARDGVGTKRFTYRTRRIPDCDCEEDQPLDTCMVGTWEMTPESRARMFGEDEPVGGRGFLTFYPSGAFVQVFSNLAMHGVSYTASGKLKMMVDKGYQGRIRGCVSTVPEGRRLDGAVPMPTEVVSDEVVRHLTITHGGVGTTTAKTENGLEAWFWPHKSAYVRCDGDSLTIGSQRGGRTYERLDE